MLSEESNEQDRNAHQHGHLRRTLLLWSARSISRKASTSTIDVTSVFLALPAVFALERFVEAPLFGVSGLHVPTIALAGLVLIGAPSAAMPPAWRAATVNPRALRL